MRTLVLATFLLACSSLAGCSLFVGSTQSVTVTASDPEADIYVDGNLIGKGVATVDLKRNRSHAFMAKVGDRAGTATTSYSMSTTGVLDIVGGILWLVPFLGALGPGFWELDSDQINIAVPPKR